MQLLRISNWKILNHLSNERFIKYKTGENLNFISAAAFNFYPLAETLIIYASNLNRCIKIYIYQKITLSKNGGYISEHKKHSQSNDD